MTDKARASANNFDQVGPQVHIMGVNGQPNQVGLSLGQGQGITAAGDIHLVSNNVSGGAGTKITNNLYLNLNTNFIK